MQKILVSLLIMLTTGIVNAETSVWKATKNGATVYLGGTIHLLRSSDYPLPKEFEKAYKSSQVLTFETDIAKLQEPEMAVSMIKELSYSDDRTISTVVSSETFNQLKNYASSHGMPIDYFRKAKPGLLMSTFMIMELRQMGVKEEGIDMYFTTRAQKDSKTMKYLETPEEQLSFLADLGIGNEEQFYQNMLKDLGNTKAQFIEIIKYWRSGDSVNLDKLMSETMKKDYPKMYQSLLVDRNNNWMPAIEKYFESPEVEFVLVGAAHLIGEDGVINQLMKKGYKISKL
ncbi:TraB/GumN family protein [Aliikangiella coralliicola]|uniref:TraB/GumN family protein n=1 Tax=Aliikangiella coralliicola TaxID=2592383 RepID=A0A545UE21_9GAMM|nr:TraB/GumN family protein [Aliikangiella coralliicola]TQV87710.1 TraB/GumN family protein [Aliikangiella coralliicola]